MGYWVEDSGRRELGDLRFVVSPGGGRTNAGLGLGRGMASSGCGGADEEEEGSDIVEVVGRWVWRSLS